jgi:hypothetical protein
MVGISSWSEAASFAAFCFTMYLLIRHIWRDIGRPFLETIHVLKPHKASRQDVLDALEGGE